MLHSLEDNHTLIELALVDSDLLGPQMANIVPLIPPDNILIRGYIELGNLLRRNASLKYIGLCVPMYINTYDLEEALQDNHTLEILQLGPHCYEELDDPRIMWMGRIFVIV